MGLWVILLLHRQFIRGLADVFGVSSGRQAWREHEVSPGDQTQYEMGIYFVQSLWLSSQSSGCQQQ